jgi:Fic family protein
MEKYNWQQDDWPEFKFSLETVDSQLFKLAEMMGRVSGENHTTNKRTG